MVDFVSPDDLAQRRKMAQNLMMQGTSAEPVQHWTQGLARVLQGGIGGMWNDQAREGEKQNQTATMDALSASPQFGSLSQQERGLFAANPALLNHVAGTVYGNRFDPTNALKPQLMQAQINNLNRREDPDIVRTLRAAGIDPRSPKGQELIGNSIKGNDPVGQVISDAMKNLNQPQPSSPVRPQSFNGGAPGTPQLMPMANGQGPGEAPGGDPMLIQAQTAQRPVPQQEPVFDTPLGPMPQSKARLLGFGLAYQGKGDAGKMFANPDALGKEAANKVDEQELKAVNALGRLRQIASGFKPEYLTIEEKAKQYGVSWLDSFGSLRSKLPPEVQKEHADFTAFQRDAFENLTEGIRDATGAAMGIQEEGRIRKGLPDPAKDGPIQFAAKLKGTVRAVEESAARTQYLRKNGFKGDGHAAERAMPVDAFKKKISDDSEQTYRQLRSANPNASETDVLKAVRQQIRASYGINI